METLLWNGCFCFLSIPSMTEPGVTNIFQDIVGELVRQLEMFL